MKKTLVILLCSVFLGLLNMFGQQTDTELWIGATVEKSFKKKFNLTFKEGLRLNNNVAHVNMIFSQLGLSYRINKYLKIKASYRSSARYKYHRTTVMIHRYQIDAYLRYKLKPVVFNARIRYQASFSDYQTDRFTVNPKHYIRIKPYVKVKAHKKVTPYVAGELFFPLNNPKIKTLDGYRIYIGTTYQLNRSNNFELFAMMEQELNETNPYTSFVIGINYTLTIDKLVKKLKKKLKEKDKEDRS